jgi:hypothetical protein|tara:strand:- start:6067 stop:8379 length:2313 start_codon:yes stop_codon:yes gene_type:complete
MAEKFFNKVQDKFQESIEMLLDPFGNRKSEVALNTLLKEGHDILNKNLNRMETSFAFWDREKKILGDKYTSNEIEEALMAREIEQEKALLTGTGQTINVQAFKDQLINDKNYQEYVKKYFADREKASEFKLLSDEYTATGRAKAVTRYQQPIKDSLNRMASQVSSSYGIIPELLNLIDLGPDRSFVETKIGNHSYMLPVANSPVEQKVINTLSNYLDSKQGSLKDTDVSELQNLLKNVSINYQPISTSSSKGISDYTEDSNMRKTIQAIVLDEQYPDNFKEKIIAEGGEQAIKYTDIIENIDDSQKQDFQENYQTIATMIKKVFNDTKLVPQGGTLEDSQIATIAFEALIENGFLKTEIKPRLGILSDVVSDYTRITPSQYQTFFNNLPEYLNRLSADTLTGEQLDGIFETVKIIENEQQKIDLQDPLHPRNLAGIVRNQIETGAVTRFATVEDRDIYIENSKQNFKEQGYRQEDIDYFATEVGTIEPIALAREMQTSLNKENTDQITLEDIKKGGEVLAKKTNNLFGNVRDPYMIMEGAPKREMSKTDISNLTSAIDILGGKPSLLEKNREEESINLTVATDMNNRIIEQNKNWDVASVGIENVDAAFNNVFLDLLAKMESDNRNIRQLRRKSTASGYYQMTEAAVKEAIKNIPNVEELHPEVIESLNKPWIKGKNNLEDVNKSTQAKLALTYLFNLKVSGKAGRGDTYIKEFTQAYLDNNYSEMANIWKKFYSEGWHTLDKKTKKLPLNVSNRLEEITKDYFDNYTGI